MKRALVLLALMSGTLSASVQKPGYLTATVVSVESQENPSNHVGSNPSDAPLQSEIYTYEIGIRLGCTIYRTHYDSAFDYLPSVFAANHPIQIYPRKRVMHVR